MISLAVMWLLFSSGDALKCYQWGCAPGSSGLSPCYSSPAFLPTPQEITCPQGQTMCMKQTGLLNSEAMKIFGCVQPDAIAQQLGIENGGCADPKEILMNAGSGVDTGGLPVDQMSDMEICLCDTPLCNTASKKAF